MHVYICFGKFGMLKNWGFQKIHLYTCVCFDYVGLASRKKTACMQNVYLMLVFMFLKNKKNKIINIYDV
jgi:hypothetical protein